MNSFTKDSKLLNDENHFEIISKKISTFKVVTKIVKSKSAAQASGFPIGTHTLINTGRLDHLYDTYDNTYDCIDTVLEQFFSPFKGKTLLICGLGCQDIIVDSLGPETIWRIKLPMMERISTGETYFKKIAAIIPGVAQDTNMNTALHISAVATAIGADCVLLINSICGFYDELCSTIHINDTGTDGINAQTVGVPVFSIAVPTSCNPTERSKGNVGDEITLIGINRIVQRAALILGYAIMHKFYPSADEDLCTTASLSRQDQL